MTGQDNPYVGPRSYLYGEALFGRDVELQILLDLVISRRLVLLHAPSGAGKTSLIQAALRPALEREGFIVLPSIRVGQALPEGLMPGETRNPYVMSVLMSLEETIRGDSQLSTSELASLRLDQYLELRFGDQERTRDHVFIFDQFEEILTTRFLDRHARAEFFAQLGGAFRNAHRWALFALREDHLGALEPWLSALPQHLHTRFRLDLLGVDAARQAVQAPARSAGVEFPDPVAQRLMDDLRRVTVQQPEGTVVDVLGPYVEPVQLQVVCRRLWERLPEGAERIDMSAMEEVGDVNQALAGYYRQCVEAIAADSGVPLRRVRDWIEQELITPQGIRGQVLQEREQSAGLENDVIRALEDAHLIRAEERRGASWFELSHDRLIEPIRSDNVAWRQAHLHPLQSQAALWEKQGEPAALLLSDEALTEAEAWAATHLEQVTPSELQYLEKSREAAEQRRAIEEVRNRALETAQRLAEEQSRRAEEQTRHADDLRRSNLRRKRLALFNVAIATLFFLAAAVAWAFYEIVKFKSEGHRRSEAAALDARERAREAGLRSYALLRAVRDPTLAVLSFLETKEGTNHADWSQAMADASEYPLAEAVLTAKSDLVLTMDFHPDGSRILTGYEDGSIVVQDIGGRQRHMELTGHEGAVVDAEFSHDGNFAVTASRDGTARIWDLRGDARPILLLGHTKPLTLARFSPDSARVLTASEDGTARVWRSDGTGVPLVLQGDGDPILSAEFSPDGTRVVTATLGGSTRIWRTEAADPPLVLQAPGRLRSATFSPSGQWVATACIDGPVRLWHTDKRQGAIELKALSPSRGFVEFSPDGSHIGAAHIDGSVRVVRVDGSGKPLVLRQEAGQFAFVEFSPDGDFLTTGVVGRSSVVLHEVKTGRKVELKHAIRTIGGGFSPDGSRVATVLADGSVRIWRIRERVHPLFLSGHSDRVNSVQFSSDGQQVVTASEDGTSRLWRLAEPETSATFAGQMGKVRTASFSPDAKHVLTGGDDGVVRLWRTDGGGGPESPGRHAGAVLDAAWSRDSKFVVTAASDGTAQLWDVARRRPELSLQGHTGAITSVAISPDGTKIATASHDGTARVWRADKPAPPVILTGHTGPVHTITFSADGERVLTASSDRTARLWHIARPLDPLVFSHSDPPVAAHLSPGGKIATLVLRTGSIQLWDTKTGRPINRPAGRGTVVVSAIVQDGSLLATGGLSGEVEVWNLETGQHQIIDGQSTREVTALSFSPDNSRLAIAHGDGTVIAVELTLSGLRRLLENATSACLPPDERMRALGEEELEACQAFAACETRHGRVEPTCSDP